MAWHELGSELIDPRSLLLGLQVLQELYFLGIWSVLHQVLLHEPVAAPDDIAEHLLRAALANSGELLPHPLCVRLPQILDQQQRVPPLAFDPGPDRLDGVEVGRAGRQEFYDDSFLIEMAPMMVTFSSCSLVRWTTKGSNESLGCQILGRVAHMLVLVSSMKKMALFLFMWPTIFLMYSTRSLDISSSLLRL